MFNWVVLSEFFSRGDSEWRGINKATGLEMNGSVFFDLSLNYVLKWRSVFFIFRVVFIGFSSCFSVQGDFGMFESVFLIHTSSGLNGCLKSQ